MMPFRPKKHWEIGCECHYFNTWPMAIRDGPFDIQGGAGIFPGDKLFFSLFLHNKLFFSKVNCNKFFIFLEKITPKNQKNVNKATH